jgi:NifU-like protein
MSHRKFILSFPWAKYSKKLARHIEQPRHVGFFTQEEAAAKGMRLILGIQGSFSEGHFIQLYLLIDESDAVIADVKFQVFGPSVLIGALEGLSELLIRKTVTQMSRMTAELIDRHLQDKPDVSAFPEETFSHVNLVIDLIEEALVQCQDLMLENKDPVTPLTETEDSIRYPDWELLTKEQKLDVIEEVIAADIRPYIELDAGGIQLLDFVNDKELIIAYQGACTSCHSATGATLNAIQGILRAKLSPDIVVVPDASFLN